MLLREFIKNNIHKIINEVDYLNPNNVKTGNTIGEMIRVYHGFTNIKDVVNVLTYGLSGDQKIKRVNSIETAPNTGLFVTSNFDLSKDYAYSGIIIEFTVNIDKLLPVSDGASGTYNYRTAYDNLLSPTKSEALFVGNLNPNQIKYIWSKDKENYKWVKYTRKEFIDKLKIDTKRSKLRLFLPNDDFDMSKIITTLYKSNIESNDFKRYVNMLETADADKLTNLGFFPKQINQIIQMRNNGDFDKYVN